MNEDIKFSVLVPVYNVMEYVEECIQSVLAQTYSNYELILVDDGSTDRSGIIIDQYSKQYPQIKTYHKSNKGLIHTRRYAIDRAVGDYYVMLDSDDMIEKKCLEILYLTIKRHNCDCVFYNRKRLIEGKYIGAEKHIEEEYLSNRSSIIRKALIDIPYNSFCLKCAKSSMYSRIDYSQYYHISKGEDALQSLELLSNCNTAEFIDDELYIYRMRMGSICNPIDQTDYEIDLTVREKCLQFIVDQNCFTEDDMNKYRDRYIKFYIDQIILAGSLRMTVQKKKEAYKELRSKKYYTDFLSKGLTGKNEVGTKIIIWFLFKHKLDTLLIMIISAYNTLRDVKTVTTDVSR